MGIPTNPLYIVICVGTAIGRPQIHNQIRGFSKGCAPAPLFLFCFVFLVFSSTLSANILCYNENKFCSKGDRS
jgi:hypothetical protein